MNEAKNVEKVLENLFIIAWSFEVSLVLNLGRKASI